MKKVMISCAIIGTMAGCSGGSGTQTGTNDNSTNSTTQYMQLGQSDAKGELKGNFIAAFSSFTDENLKDARQNTISGTLDNASGNTKLTAPYVNSDGVTEATFEFTGEDFRINGLSKSNPEKKYTLKMTRDPDNGDTYDSEARAFYQSRDFQSDDALDYDYVVYFDETEYVTDTSGRRPIASALGVLGAATTTGDMPTTDSAKTATYTGSTVLYGSASGDIVTKHSGTSKFEANFGEAKAALTLNEFVLTDGPDDSFMKYVDQVIIDDMNISGNSFSGGRVNKITAVDSGNDITSVLGSTSTTTTQGTFFGYDSANNIPDEVGGTYKVIGDMNSLGGAFIAD